MLQLKPYQEAGIDWLRQRPRALLADEAGLGKSAQLLVAAEEPVLIVAPAMVLESGTWDDEIEKWAPGIDATQVAYSSLAQRGPKGTVPRDSNGFPLTPPKPQYAQPWGTVIGDECHYIKGRKTSWANAFLDLADLAGNLELATGTPIPNWAAEAFMLLRALRPDQAKPGGDYGSYWRWVKTWFHVGDGRFGMEVGDLCDEDHINHCRICSAMGRTPRTWEEFRRANWGDLMIRRLRDDVLSDLPPLTRQEWLTPMSTEQAKLYRKLKKDYIAFLDSGESIEVWSEPGMLVKLAQVATGMEVLDPTSKPTGKLKALQAILTDRPRQTLVIGHFQKTIEACHRAAKLAGKRASMVHGGIRSESRKIAIRAFQRGEIDVLCASIGTISEGVTLHQGGADQVIFVERSWTPSKNEQAVRRLHRIGQERPVIAIDMVTPNSVDERVSDLLRLKSDQQMHALTAMEVRDLL